NPRGGIGLDGQFIALFVIVLAADGSVATPPPRNTSDRLGLGLVGVRVDKLDDKPAVLKRGMSGYLLPFEIVSVHLLVVLVGAAYLARTKRRARS
ncbi:MAG TPA: hypothetical protein VGX76_01825, partial [Pirellulales bacterium]|nr:hypothetical protein [Pirellulales bacterium]